MSKNTLPRVGSRMITHFENNRVLEGELLTLVETFGFEKTREDAVKSLVRRTVWDYFGAMKYVPAELEEQVEKLFMVKPTL